MRPAAIADLLSMQLLDDAAVLQQLTAEQQQLQTYHHHQSSTQHPGASLPASPSEFEAALGGTLALAHSPPTPNRNEAPLTLPEMPRLAQAFALAECEPPEFWDTLAEFAVGAARLGSDPLDAVWAVCAVRDSQPHLPFDRLTQAALRAMLRDGESASLAWIRVVTPYLIYSAGPSASIHAASPHADPSVASAPPTPPPPPLGPSAAVTPPPPMVSAVSPLCYSASPGALPLVPHTRTSTTPGSAGAAGDTLEARCLRVGLDPAVALSGLLWFTTAPPDTVASIAVRPPTYNLRALLDQHVRRELRTLDRREILLADRFE